jgi:hypothetical protein
MPCVWVACLLKASHTDYFSLSSHSGFELVYVRVINRNVICFSYSLGMLGEDRSDFQGEHTQARLM